MSFNLIIFLVFDRETYFNLIKLKRVQVIFNYT